VAGISLRSTRATASTIKASRDRHFVVRLTTFRIQKEQLVYLCRRIDTEAFSNIGLAMMSHIGPHALALIVLLLVVVFGYVRGRGHAPAWTNIPLVALATLSIGPSLCAVMLYLAYKFGLMQPDPRGYRFSSFIYSLPLDFALMNWAFVPLYVVGRLWPRAGAMRPAMWFAVVAMSVPNLILFALAPEMLSTAYDAGQGIGIIQAVLLWSPILMIVPGLDSLVLNAPYWLVLSALLGFLPLLGLAAWLLGQLAGWQLRGTDQRRA
jgi:hypothetical protein